VPAASPVQAKVQVPVPGQASALRPVPEPAGAAERLVLAAVAVVGLPAPAREPAVVAAEPRLEQAPERASAAPPWPAPVSVLPLVQRLLPSAVRPWLLQQAQAVLPALWLLPWPWPARRPWRCS